ncbi:MAG TPA: PKD domain-containing protein [Chloroflexi bacterium]|nr:PKD domain-containing protein [Chloroflexota bacterium]
MSLPRTIFRRCLRIVLLILACSLSLCVLTDASLRAQDGTLAVMAAPAAPVLTSPINDATVTGLTDAPLGVPLFRWETMPGVTKYQIQVSTTDGFASTVVNAETENASYTPTRALGDGIFYWRVRAWNGQWGAYSAVQQFRLSWSADGAIRPALLSPANGAVRAAFAHDDFSWTAVPGAATYRLEIARNADMSNVIKTVTTAALHHTPTERLGNSIYYWRVTPLDYRGHAGAASDIASFTFNWNIAPQLLSPADAAELRFTPRFAWTAVEGAREYRLQISTQDNFNTYQEIITRNTDYTPVASLSNDQDYFWRVQAVDAQGAGSPWSAIRRYRMKWNFTPQLLSPANNSIHLAYPFFAWTPVPGAERYQIQIASNNAFDVKIVDATLYNVTSYVLKEWPVDATRTQPETAYYWQVRAIDAQGNVTPWSEAWSFQFSDPTGGLGAAYPTTPNLIYPLPYYTPDAVNTPVHGDRAFAWPLFIWDTAHVPGAHYGEPADYYLLEVDDNMEMTSPNFSITTAGLAAAPTDSHPFAALQEGVDYFWQVTAYKDGTPTSIAPVKWRTRYRPANSELPLSETATALYPADDFVAVGQPPVLGWLPVRGATHYHVEIADTPDFSHLVDIAAAHAVNYAPWQGRLQRMPYGAYWWRVRAEDASHTPLGDWSQARNFKVAVELAIGNIYDFPPQADLAADASGRAKVATNTSPGDDEFALYDLFTTVDRRPDENYNQHWVIAFTTPGLSATPMHYALYFDADHVVGSGGATDPRNNAIVTEARYQPEYVLYIDPQGSGAVGAFYRWQGSNWAAAQNLSAIGGFLTYTDTTRSFQVLLPYAALGSVDTNWGGSLALTLFSVDDSGIVRDDLPAQSGALAKPVFVSNMLLPLYPFDTPLSNPFSHLDMPPLRWRTPGYVCDGYQLQVARDPAFTDIVETWNTWENFSPLGVRPTFALFPATFQSLNAYANNESYYWRVRVRHEKFAPPPRTDYDFGPWSPPMRFRLDSRQVGAPQLSTGVNAFMTPTFSWQRVEGAASYQLQIDDDLNFSSPLIDQNTNATSFTPTDVSATLQPGVQYYWRAAMRRSGAVIGHWTETMTFTKSSVAPVLISAAPVSAAGQSESIHRQPTLRWTAVLTPSQEPRLAASKYRLQVANNAQFLNPTINIDTQATAYTPVTGKNLADGVWYWRVAMVDGNGNIGPYSPTQSFTKQYPPPLLVTTPDANGAPLLAWTPIDGAAYYKLEYADNPNYNNSTKVSTDLTRYAPDKALPFSTYYWRVQLVDADGVSGPLDNGQFSYYVPATFVYTPTQGIAPVTIYFTDTTAGSLTSWQWNFGDGGVSAIRNPSHLYTTAGVYTVTLQNVTSYGFTRTATITEAVRIYQRARAAFSATPLTGATPLQVTFVDQSSGDITRWLWNFGDGVTSEERYPTHVYTSPGVYQVVLSVFGPGGTDTMIRQNLITVSAPATSTPQPTPTAAPTATPAPTLVPPLPIVSGVEPTSDNGQVQITVTVRGNGFTPAAQVYFGEHLAADVTFVSSEQLQAVKPAGMTRATYALRVCNDAQTCGELPAAFTVTVDDIAEFNLYLPTVIK